MKLTQAMLNALKAEVRTELVRAARIAWREAKTIPQRVREKREARCSDPR